MKEGSQLPAVSLPDENGQERTLEELSGERGLVLYAYPKDDTPGCTIEAKDFRDRLEAFRAAGFNVVGISRDAAKSHCKFIDKYGLTFPLLTDAEGSFLERIGALGEKKMFGRSILGVRRSTVVAGRDGKVLKSYPKVSAIGHAQRVLDDVRGLT